MIWILAYLIIGLLFFMLFGRDIAEGDATPRQAFYLSVLLWPAINLLAVIVAISEALDRNKENK